MSWLDYVIIALATWRLAYFIAREDGPWLIAQRIRARFPLGGLTSCLYCASFWTGALAFGLWLTPLQPIVVILALSGAALMLASYTGVNHAG